MDCPPVFCEGFIIVLQFRYRFSLSVVLVLFVFSVAACGGSSTPAPAAVENQPAATALPTVAPTMAVEPTEELVAVVNGESITRAQFEGELRREAARLAEVGVVPADQAAFEATVLTNMLDQKLIEQAAVVQGLAVTEEEVNAEITLNIELAGGDEAFQNWLAENLFSEAEYRVSIYSALLTAKIRDQVIVNVPQNVEQVHARHILVSTEAEAVDIHNQLVNGADFGELAFQYSRDVSTREVGGDLGWFARELLTETIVADTAFALDEMAISEPIPSRLGYHILQTLGRVEERPLDDVSRAMLFEITFERWRQSLWNQATVERFIGG